MRVLDTRQIEDHARPMMTVTRYLLLVLTLSACVEGDDLVVPVDVDAAVAAPDASTVTPPQCGIPDPQRVEECKHTCGDPGMWCPDNESGSACFNECMTFSTGTYYCPPVASARSNRAGVLEPPVASARLTPARARATLSPMLHLRARRMVKVPGIYPRRDGSYDLPERLAYLSPEAADAYKKIRPFARVSDMYRDPAGSLDAIQRRRKGIKPPGYSNHNFLGAIDLALESDMKTYGLGALELHARLYGVRGKQALDDTMAAAGWFCHRSDHKLGFEAWHYNYLGVGAHVHGDYSSDEAEAKILRDYGHALAPSVGECQVMLKRIKLYSGEIDDDPGPLTRQACRQFENTWGLVGDGVLDARTRRVLAVVTAKMEVVA